MAVDVVVTGTGPLLSLDDAKLHLRVTGDDEDTLIEGYADAATLFCLQYCNLDLVPAGAETQFRQAVLLLTGQWYRNRMAVNVGNIVNHMPFGVTALIDPYRSLRV